VSRIAIAVFVKTLKQSPLKTRLALGIGQEQANTFHDLACSAVKDVLNETRKRSAQPISIFWAVAEAPSVGSWPDFPNISQGNGCLGSRLALVYKNLLETHDTVVLMAADSPQISPDQILAAIGALGGNTLFAIGKACDGGFYLIAGRAPVDEASWRKVTYSDTATAQELAVELTKIGEVTWLPGLTDVDHREDLPQLYQELQNESQLLPAQRRLRDWLVETRLLTQP
jgi:uncharacterized protein